MRFLRRYALFLPLYVLVVLAAIWEFRILDSVRIEEGVEASPLSAEAETVISLYPEDPESELLLGRQAMFLRFDMNEARQHFERGVARGVKTDERLLYYYAVSLILTAAEESRVEAAIKRWRRNFPHSGLADPRQEYARETFPAWMQAGTRRPVALAPDLSAYAMVDERGTIQLRELRTGSIRQLESNQGEASKYLLGFSADASTLAACGDDPHVRLWDTESRSVRAVLRGHTQPVYAIAFSPDGQTCVTGSLDRSVRRWRVSDGAEQGVPGQHERCVSAVAFSPRGTNLASGCWSGEIRIWGSAGEKQRALRGHRGAIACLAFSPDGRLLASASRDGTTIVWEAESGRLLHTLEGHQAPVYCVAFSHTGNTLASGSGDRSMKLWQVSTGKLLHDVGDYDDSVFAVAFAPDRKTVVAACFDNSIQLFQR